jgi:DNA mismatch endonuclease (patch repair protein)
MKYKFAIFVGGDFWHENKHKIRRPSKPEDLFPTYSRFWPRKIPGNIQRDHQANQRLIDDGWTVIRIWASTVLINPNESAQSIQNTLVKLKSNNII